MFKKAITIAIAMTLLAALPAWFISTRTLQPGAGLALALLLGVFLISGISSWLTAAAMKKGKSRRRRKAPSARRPQSSAQRESGKVKWFNASKGFGFITRDSGDDVFVHFRSIRGEGHRILRDGQRVEFAVSQGDKGLQAEDVATTG